MSEQALKGFPLDCRASQPLWCWCKWLHQSVLSSLFSPDPQASVSASSADRGELAVGEGLYCAIQSHLRADGSSKAIAEFKMCCPAEGAAKKRHWLLLVFVFILILPWAPEPRWNFNVVMPPGALRKAHAVPGCHALCTCCFWNLRCVLCTPIIDASGGKVGFWRLQRTNWLQMSLRSLSPAHAGGDIIIFVDLGKLRRQTVILRCF